MAARPPAARVHPGAHDGEERQIARERVVVQPRRQRQHRKAGEGQQRGGERLIPDPGVGDGEECEQCGEAAGDGRGKRVRGEAREGHGEADTDDGPGRVAQPQPSRVRSHQHPLQHRLALPTMSWHEKGAAGSAAPSTGFMTASEHHLAQVGPSSLGHWHSLLPFRCAMGTPMDHAGPDCLSRLARAWSPMQPGGAGRPGPCRDRRGERIAKTAVPVTAADLPPAVRGDAVEPGPDTRAPPKAKTTQRDR